MEELLFLVVSPKSAAMSVFQSISFSACVPSTHLHLSLSLSSLLPLSPNFPPPHLKSAAKKSRKLQLLRGALPENPPPSVASEKKHRSREAPVISASDVVRKFYDGINRHDLAAVEHLIALNCIYEDLVFPRPFVGRKAILEFFGKFIDYVSKDLQFVIDAISEEDSSAVGVTWHLEWNGRPFPFSKGCSFYRLEVISGIRQIVYARDCVEPAIKPGESTLIIIRCVTWLLQRFPKLMDWI